MCTAQIQFLFKFNACFLCLSLALPVYLVFIVVANHFVHHTFARRIMWTNEVLHQWKHESCSFCATLYFICFSLKCAHSPAAHHNVWSYIACFFVFRKREENKNNLNHKLASPIYVHALCLMHHLVKENTSTGKQINGFSSKIIIEIIYLLKWFIVCALTFLARALPIIIHIYECAMMLQQHNSA